MQHPVEWDYRDKSLSRNISHINRQQRRYKALGFFVACWLNLALQPCAMAFEGPRDSSDDSVTMSATHAQHADMDHEVPCSDAAADCMLADTVNHDARNGQESSRQPADILVAITVSTEPVAVHKDSRHDPRFPRYSVLQPGGPPDLHVLYCVYLD